MPARRGRRGDRREPEKTPLIDVIFLLLIFFFVTIAVDPDVVDPGQTEGSEQHAIELLPMSYPPEVAPDSLDRVLLIQLLPGRSFTEARAAEINQVIGEINAAADFGQYRKFDLENGSLDQQFIVSFFDKRYSDIGSTTRMVTELSDSLRLYQNSPTGTLRQRIRRLISKYLPFSLPFEGALDFQNQYSRAVAAFGERIRAHFPEGQTPSEKPEIHIRMDGRVYVKVTQDIFAICREEGVALQHVKFRVMEHEES